MPIPAALDAAGDVTTNVVNPFWSTDSDTTAYGDSSSEDESDLECEDDSSSDGGDDSTGGSGPGGPSAAGGQTPAAASGDAADGVTGTRKSGRSIAGVPPARLQDYTVTIAQRSNIGNRGGRSSVSSRSSSGRGSIY